MTKKVNRNNKVSNVVELVMENDKPMVSSLVVAEMFKKRHDNVLKAISNLETPEDFNALNFKAVKYADSKGELRPAFNMTRDGFSMLAMGFTGKKAAIWKIKFLEAFNAMERKLTIPQVEANFQIKKATPEAIKSFEGLARYWCYLENFSWEQGKRQIEAAIRVPDIYEMDALALNSAWTYISLCTRIVPPKMRGLNVCSEEELSPVIGLLDYWSYSAGNSKNELETNLCKRMGIDALEQLPKSYLPHAVSLAWENIHFDTGKCRAFKEASH